jgi:solute carrier family 6 amino acid transporter-like protein 5/7/9/14
MVLGGLEIAVESPMSGPCTSLISPPLAGDQGIKPTHRYAPTEALRVSTHQEFDDAERVQWGRKIEFLLSCIGSAVGLGNVWRFPYLCYKNGGGAFLIPYVLMFVIVGLPLFFMELALGQFASLGPIAIWRINPLLKGLGVSMVLVSFIVSVYYNVIIAQAMFYLCASLTDKLPWTTCDNHWNTKSCMVLRTDDSSTNATQLISTDLTLTNLTFTTASDRRPAPSALEATRGLYMRNVSTTPAEEYYNNFVLQKSSSIEEFGTPGWELTICLLVSWIIVGGAVIKGIKSLGKIAYFTTIFPYFMLTALLIRGVTLDGAADGIIYYLKPDFYRLADPVVWSDAATQIIYSLGACTGGLITMSSFNKFTNTCRKDAVIVSVLNGCTSIFAGFVVFSILGFLALEKGVDVHSVATGGPGLAFEVYPEALARMDVAPMWAAFFFLMMATLGFGSQFSCVECIMSALLDEFPKLRKSPRNTIVFRISVLIVSFGLGIPFVCNGGSYLLELVDYSVGGFPLLFIGFVELIAINWIYGFSKFWQDIEMMIGDVSKIYWKICWTLLAPLVILVVIILNIWFYADPALGGTPYPVWSKVLSKFIAFTPISIVIIWFICTFCKRGGYTLLKLQSRPLPYWGPASTKNIFLGNRSSTTAH